MDVGTGREDWIERYSSWDGRTGALHPGYVLAFHPNFCPISKHCFFHCAFGDLKCLLCLCPSIFGFYQASRGEAKHFYIKSSQNFLVQSLREVPQERDKLQNNSLSKMIVLGLLGPFWTCIDSFWTFVDFFLTFGGFLADGVPTMY